MPSKPENFSAASKEKETSISLIDRIRKNVVGERDLIEGPFGPRALIYADYVASGRSLDFIEQAIRDTVLPVYGNTHTETSYTGREITALREEARHTIARAVGADDRHIIIFSGNGATSAIDRLVRVMDLEDQVRKGNPPVIFVGPYEHHSNDLPWRETGAIIERISLNQDGQIDLVELEERLQHQKDADLKIGAFSAASNVTGIRSDLTRLSRLLKKHRALFVCDFAAAAPYIEMKMQQDATDPDTSIDAIIYSSHKFIGGPGASGVLIADKSLFLSKRPAITGGGTVSYVTARHHTYVRDLERREEGGTPDIVGDIRAGAVMALKEAVGSARIEQLEDAITTKAYERLAADPDIEILGPLDQKRIGVLSFNIRASGFRLHYGFVVALLNDLFGIQARGGCSCAGPYAHHLLDIPMENALKFEEAISTGSSIMRPGWIRLGFNYFFDEETADYIVNAILFISKFGTCFLRDYTVDFKSGIWKHRATKPKIPASLGSFWITPDQKQAAKPQDLNIYLSIAMELAQHRAQPSLRHTHIFTSKEETLREFWIPEDALWHDTEKSETKQRIGAD